MKVVLCKGQFQGPISGADETLVVYATQLRSAGHSPTVLLMYPYQRGDSYYQRLRRVGVPVISIASPPVRASLDVGRKVASGLLRNFPLTRHMVRQKAHKISARVNGRYLRPCQDFLERHRPDLIHVVTPDPSAMTFIRAAHGANVPVLYQELGMPFHPPGFEACYERFTAVLPLCTEVSTLSPALAEQCRELLPHVGEISVLPIMAEDTQRAAAGARRSAGEVT
nr:glycosyltransferase [Acidobacteriota bacterium]